MNMHNTIKAVVRGEFEDAAEAFNKNPNGDAWSNLCNAMWARQAISSPDTMEKAVPLLSDTPIQQWIETLRTIHEGKKS